MAIHVVRLDEIASSPWRNGGGRTRELLCWPGSDWMVRISVADVEGDGAFSVFPGVERWFAVIEGEGVTLSSTAGQSTVVAGSAPLCFDGGTAPYCRLANGPTRDLNLMLRQARGSMTAARGAWRERFALRTLFAASHGRWSDGTQHLDLEPGMLLWSDDDDAAEWHFAGDGAAWWMGATP